MKMQTGLVFAMIVAVIFSLPTCDNEDDDSTSSEPANDDADDDDTDDDDTLDDDAPAQYIIYEEDLDDKIRGSWIGQMAGVAWGAPTEFQYTDGIIDESEVPEWQPDRINNGYVQDDVYVEIPFIDVMTNDGVNASWVLFGEAFKVTHFLLAHANLVARVNLRNGIAAPDSGHYDHNKHCDDIDWQIEADFVGTLCPGLVNQAIELSWRAGHVMNYGDGVLGGVFMAAMHAAAFFAEDIMDIVEAGRKALPEGSQYRMVVEEVIARHALGDSWEETWQYLQSTWGAVDRCPGWEHDFNPGYNIAAKLNGAYVLLGLLYGEGDFEKSMEIAMRCGQDSDCNPSSVGGILGNWMGFSNIPEKFKSGLDETRNFMFTDYTLNDAISINLELTKQVMLMAKASSETSEGGELWTIPSGEDIEAPILEQWPWEANAKPVLSAQAVDQDGMTVTFEAEATDADGILAYEWYFGDLSRAKGEHVEHTYRAAGSYEVIVYVADGIGNTSWQAIPIIVP
jgi:ADP-ribosylglycohydrolase